MSEGHDVAEVKPGSARIRSTKEVMDHHLACLAAGDLEGVLADYASDAVLVTPPGFFTPDGILRGREGAGHGFEILIREFGSPGASFDLEHVTIEGDYAYMVWHAVTPQHTFDFGSDTFVIRQGRIVAQTFAGKIGSR
jgi:ketosteroid isomerase-like protein